MKAMLRRFVFDDRGQDLIEYALLSSLIGIVGILAWTNVGGRDEHGIHHLGHQRAVLVGDDAGPGSHSQLARNADTTNTS